MEFFHEDWSKDVSGGRPRFRIGDWVTFTVGTNREIARIIEDRGCIGVGGRRLFRIERPFDEGEPDRFEMPEECLAPAEPHPKPAKIF